MCESWNFDCKLKYLWKLWWKNWSKSTKINFWQFWLILVKSKLTKIDFSRFSIDFCRFWSILVWFLSILIDFGRFYNRHNRLQKSVLPTPPHYYPHHFFRFLPTPPHYYPHHFFHFLPTPPNYYTHHFFHLLPTPKNDYPLHFFIFPRFCLFISFEYKFWFQENVETLSFMMS